jgi:hypothetical protein
MDSTKTLMAASAVVSLFAAAGAASAAIVGTGASVSANSASNFLTTSGPGTMKATQVSTLTLTGTGTLDDGGTFTASTHGTVTAVTGGVGTVTTTDVFTGSYVAGTFTPSAGSLDILTCTGNKTVCNGATHPAVKTFNTGVGGSLTLAGGRLTGTEFIPSAGTVGAVTSSYSFTVGAFTPVTSSGSGPTVPLPPAAWLLGSGLLGLVGTARRRRKT